MGTGRTWLKQPLAIMAENAGGGVVVEAVAVDGDIADPELLHAPLLFSSA